MIDEWANDPAGLFVGTEGYFRGSLCALSVAMADHVPLCRGASATLWEPDAVVAMGASHPDLTVIAEQQFVAGNGPVVAALHAGKPSVTPDTLHEDRWPEFAVAALAAGARSAVTVVQEYSLMTLSLSLYAAVPGAFDPETLSLSALLSGFGAAAMAGAEEVGLVQRTAGQLDAAIRSRAVVEDARGVVMQKLGCGPDEALERLWRIAQQQRRKVTEVARRMVWASEVPGDSPPGTASG
jgi:hypothetical protein